VAATLDCDVLIVGTGLVGAVYARHLVAAGLSVVMVDAGPQLSARPGEHLRNRYLHQRDLRLYYDALVAHLYPPSVPAAAEPLFPGEAHLPPQAAGGNAVNPEQDPRRNLPGAAVTYAVGGMGVLWTCLAPRLHPGIERFPFFSPEEWEDLYARAETDLGVGREAFRGSRRGAALLAQLHAAGQSAELAPVAARRREDDPRQVHWTGPADLLEPGLEEEAKAGGGGRLRILAQHVVTRLAHRGGRVRAATVRSLDPWAEKEIRAEIFVVAAGALLSPQLLWASGILREDDSPLGRYLHDHPLAFAQVALSREIAEVADDPYPFLAIPLAAGRPFHSLLLADTYDGRLLEGGLDERLLLNLYWYALAEPRRENRITWSAERCDLHGLPQPTFHYTLSPEARARNREMLADLKEVGGLLGRFLPMAPPQLLPAGRSMHFLGTTRMGPVGDGSAVVDLDSRVWSFDNLYVGGTGTFPGPTASNPTLTACALALRSVERIVGGRRRG